MAVAGRGDQTIPTEQIKLNPMGTSKILIHPVIMYDLLESLLRVLFRKLRIDREKILIMIICAVQPCKMIDTQNIGLDLTAVYTLNSGNIRQCFCQQLLCAEYFVAAAKRLDLRKYFIQCTHTQRHRIGIVDDPCFRTIIPDRFGNRYKHGYRTQCPHDSSRAGRISYRLINAVLLRSMYIRLHLIKGARQYGDDDKIRSGQCLLQCMNRFVFPYGLYTLCILNLIADRLIVLRSLKINVIQTYGTIHTLFYRKITHQSPCPASGAAADIRDLDPRCFTVFNYHNHIFLSQS